MFKLSDRDQPIRIGFYLARGFSIVPFINAVDPLRMTNKLSGRRLFDWSFISQDGQPVEAINGMTIMVDRALKDAGDYPNVICCVEFEPIIRVRRPVKNWLRLLARRGAHLGALGAGSLYLAEAGLLDGYRSTIHWLYLEGLAERFPMTTVTRNVFEVDRDRFTCAGGTAAMDMVLHFIGLHFGHTLATDVSDQFIIGGIREASAQQRISHGTRLGLTDPRILRIINIMEAHIEDPLDLPHLAAQTGISQRQMERLFRTHVRRSPIQFYTRLRLRHARRLLHQTELSVVEVGVASGFGSTEHFSRSFKSAYGVSPAADRRVVRGVVALNGT